MSEAIEGRRAGAWRRIGPPAFLGVAALAVLAILGFYAQRLTTPLPLFAADEATYLLHALYPDETVARDPYVATATNGVHLSVIRAVFMSGAPLVLGDRLANLAAYLAGLLALWWAGVKRARDAEVSGELGLALLLIALGFAYYRFAASNLAEGLFVGVFAALVLVTRRWWRSRPLVHALAAGALGAALVLVKPNGVAELAALAALGVADALLAGKEGAREWAQLPVRIVVFAIAFFAVGNLIQWQADEPVTQPWAFFVSPTYGATMGAGLTAGAGRLGAVTALSMLSASLVLAGAPMAVGLADLWRRWRAGGGLFEADGADLAFLLVLASLAGTIAMVAVFAMKIASTPGETLRLWGRYFEFFIPMVWLAAAPSLARGLGGRTAAACAAVTFAGLAGLLVSFRAGIVLFPWDASVLTAFFQTDPVRAAVRFALPLRALSILAVLLAGAAYAARLKPAFVGLALILAVGGLSTWLDGAWNGPIAARRAAFDRDLKAIAPRLPPAGVVVFLSEDANETHLAFLGLGTRPRVVTGPPAQTPPDQLADASATIVAGPQAPPGGPWTAAYRGPALTLWARAAER
ncbi:MAG: hypothetical protein JSS35_15730 [Proteobacteria bacterium]|nr:hypothetical protein [Pseudomonadota bacterium]